MSRRIGEGFLDDAVGCRLNISREAPVQPLLAQFHLTEVMNHGWIVTLADAQDRLVLAGDGFTPDPSVAPVVHLRRLDNGQTSVLSPDPASAAGHRDPGTGRPGPHDRHRDPRKDPAQPRRRVA